MTFSNKTYDQLKFLAMILLPALGALYFAVAGIWGLPKGEEVVGTITAVDAFLGVVLGISSNKPESFDGYLAPNGINEDTGHPNLKMVITKAPQEVVAGKAVRLKVGSPPAA
jgi:hypothetical protein